MSDDEGVTLRDRLGEEKFAELLQRIQEQEAQE